MKSSEAKRKKVEESEIKDLTTKMLSEANLCIGRPPEIAESKTPHDRPLTATSKRGGHYHDVKTMASSKSEQLLVKGGSFKSIY